MLSNSLRYYLAARLILEARYERRDTREIRRRARKRKEVSSVFLSEAKFKSRFRLTKAAYKLLCEELSRKNLLQSSKRISLELKVLCALSFYATGSCQKLVGVAENLGQTTVSKIVAEVTDALVSLKNRFIKFPVTRDQRNMIKNKFYATYGFPGVIGCIDGCHFPILAPPKDTKHLFYCRKHFHSLNVQMICDSDCRILNVNAKYGGATHDALVWENSQAYKFMQELHHEPNHEEVWLLGDSGYALRPWMMTPITDISEGSPEAKYNTVHEKARLTIENAFGRLKNQWRCLNKDRTLHYSPQKCAKIIMACCVLHNLAIDFNVPLPIPDQSVIQEPTSGISGDIVVENVTANSHDLARGRAIQNMLVDGLSRLHT